MKLQLFLSELKQKGILLSITEGKLKIKAKKGLLTPEIKSQIQSFKEDIITYLSQEKLTALDDVSGDIPLSFAQQRLWFIDHLAQGSPEYNMPMALKITGNFDTDAAEKSIHRIIVRHAPLRTVFEERVPRPVQIINNDFEFKLIHHDLTSKNEKTQQQQIQKLFEEDCNKTFNLKHDLMVRASYLHLSNQEKTSQGVLLFNMHHIASDGWSMKVLLKEFVIQYQSIIQGKPDPLAPLAIQYVDYAYWQRRWLVGEVLETQLNYWSTQLSELPSVHSLPLASPRKKNSARQGAVVTNKLETNVSQQLLKIAKDNQLTPFMLLHAGIALVLSRHSNSNDIVLGTPVANRVQPELEPLIGFFVNTLVLRADTDHDMLSDYLAHIRTINFQAQSYQDIPFEQLVEYCNTPRSNLHSPLFQIMFSMDTTSKNSKLSLSGLSFTSLESESIIAKFELNITAQVSDDGIAFSWVYDTALFDQTYVQILSEHLTRLLNSIAETPDAKLKDLAMLSRPEMHYLTNELNNSKTDYVQNKCIHELFEKQVQQTPDNIAVIFEDKQLTYRELNETSNQIANFLLSQGVTSETLVGICLDRSFEMIAALLGILKCGGAYVPIDPNYPQTRIDYMLEDTMLTHLLTQSTLADKFNSINDGQLTVLDSLTTAENLQTFSTLNPEKNKEQNSVNTAYVIYTSGSTGMPKGVLTPHIGVVRLVNNPEFITLDESTRFMQASSISFDAATLEIWGPLLNGGSCVLYPERQIDLTVLNQTLESNQVNSLWLTAGLFEQWSHVAKNMRSLHWILAGGDILDTTSVKRVLDCLPDVTVVNGYGPTESTTFTTCYPMSYGDKSLIENSRPSIPIGKPINGTSLYVLSPEGHLVPLGSVGELYIGGTGLARGYLNQPEMTAEKFISNPFSDDPEDRLYKSGDLVRYLLDGNLEFAGRTDDQVKIRGFRIELGEIEIQLSQCDSVASCLVLVREDEPGQKRIVAYVTPSVRKQDQESYEQALIPELKAHLQQNLPAYMMPSAFVILEEFPLTSNGKVDKKALPAPDDTLLQGEYIAAETPTEQALVNTWSSLLKIKADDISVNANFFELGGHSLLAIRLVAEIRAQLQQELPIKFIFESSTIRAMANYIDAGSTAQLRPEITASLRQPWQAVSASFAQQRLWFIDQIQSGSSEYNIPVAIQIEGDFNVDIAEKAITRIVARHESLRTIFKEEGGQTLQFIQPDFEFNLIHHDLTQLDEKIQQEKVKNLLTEDSLKHFDLSNDLMVRAAYLQLSTQQSSDTSTITKGVLLFNMHHIASDGWSLGVLLKEFVALYQSIILGKPDPLAPLVIQYADYSLWQKEWLVDEILADQLSYWTQKLEDVPAIHSLPLDHPRSETPSHQGGVVTNKLNADVAQQLLQIATDYKLTPFMLLHAALALVISRHSNSHDIVIGTPVANRLQTELEPLIGFFVNTLVLRTDGRHEALADYLTHIRTINLDAQAHQDIPFEQLVEHCQVPRNTQHSPLFQILFTMNTNETNQLLIPGVNFTPLSSETIVSKFELDISAQINDNGMSFSWVYNTALFDQAHIETLSEHLTHLLTNIAETPDAKLKDLTMLSISEMHYLTHELNNIKTNYSQEKCIHELFEIQVQKTPDNVAVVFKDKQLTYKELNQASNQIAHYLREQGVRTETLVGICLDRSTEMIIGLLGILKSGGAYAPIDPNYPQTRIDYILKDTGLTHLVTESTLLEKFRSINDGQLTVLDSSTTAENLQTFSTLNPEKNKEQNSVNTAYIIYTSGSTGMPKGVLTPHIGVVRLVNNPEFITLDESTRFMQASSISFDAATLEIWGPLLNGGSCVLYPERQIDLTVLNQTLESNQVNSLWLTAGLFEQWSHVAKNMRSLHWILAGGDILDTTSVKRVLDCLPDVTVVNGYGPTESTTFTTCYPMSYGDKSLIENSRPSIPIGKPINGTSLYVLSPEGHLVPLGSVGELYIGGTGLARGYLNQPEMTAEKFISNPFSDDPEDRLYKSGDLVRYLLDGNLEFAGRTDDQVKIRGFRIELGEIEIQLSQCDSVASCLVLVREDEPGQKRIVAYVTPSVRKQDQESYEQALIAEFKAYLQEGLPAYMMPSAFVILEEFPLTSNGKVDKKALPAPDDTLLQGEYIAAETPTEETLVNIWSNLLKIETDAISVTANFFDLGGHSLLAVRLISEIRAQLQKELPIKLIFESSTIRLIAAHIDLGTNRPRPLRMSVTSVSRQENQPIVTSFPQQRLWFIDQLSNGSPEYNMPMAMKIMGQINLPAVEDSISEIIQRHEVLRTVYINTKQGSMQQIQNEFDFILHRHDLSHLAPASRQSQLLALIEADKLTAFDLTQDLMVRASFIQLEQSDKQEKCNGVLLFNMHHIASDGWSMEIFEHEFLRLYSAFDQGLPSPLSPLSIQYADYAHWQRNWLQGEVLDSQLNYWQQQLEDLPSVHNLMLDFPRPEVKQFSGKAVSSQLLTKIGDALTRLAKQYQITPFMLLHSALALVLSRHSNSQDIVIGTPIANRMQTELEPLIGFFVNTLVLRLDTSHQELSDYLAHVRQVHLDAQSNQDVPFEQLVERLNLPRSTAHTPLFQVMFSTNTDYGQVDKKDTVQAMSGVTLSPLSSDSITAKFDLDISIELNDNGVRINWIYDQAIFSEAHIWEFNDHLCRLLTGLAKLETTQLKPTIANLPMLSDNELAERLMTANGEKISCPESSCIHRLFETQAQKNPDAIALVFEETQISYAELNHKANQLAFYLIEQGITPNTLVGLYLERSIEMVIGILAILKAGAAYLPLDPAYPDSRINYMLEDSQLTTVLTQRHLAAKLPIKELNILCLDDELLQSQLQAYPSNNPTIEALTVSNLAYVIYTSGSTGQPKGVTISHSNVNHYVLAAQHYYHISEKDNVLQFSSISFDICVEEVFTTLSFGAKLVLRSEAVLEGGQGFWDFINQNEISVISLPTAFWHLLSASLDGSYIEIAKENLRLCIIGGEGYQANQVEHWRNSVNIPLLNSYGPTEGTVVATVYDLLEQPMDHVKQQRIGKPLVNAQCYVLDQHCQLQPKSVAGELYIGGLSVAPGYLHQVALTAERFVNNPFFNAENPYSSKKLYRTGDLVRYLSDGNLEFIGRTDDQVKIRGFRIELGEIEIQLSQCDSVASCLVLVREDEPGQKRIVAYVTPSVRKQDQESYEQALIAEFKAYLQEGLPAYMMPSAFVILEEFPLTSNGKVDKKALPAPDDTLLQGEYIAAETPTEETLVNIWSNLLKIETDAISVTANFFDLGGHSLLAVRLISEIEQTFNKPLPMTKLFSAQTLNKLALCIDELIHENDEQPLNPINNYDIMSFGNNNHLTKIFMAPALGTMAITYQFLVSRLDHLFDVKLLTTAAIDEQHGFTEDLSLNIDERVNLWYLAIKSAQPSGIYRLVGHSFGGDIMFELTKRLESEGEKVELILLDAYLDSMTLTSTEKTSSKETLAEILLGSEIIDEILTREKLTNITQSILYSNLIKLQLLPENISENKFDIYYQAAQRQLALAQSHKISGTLIGKVTLIMANTGLAISADKTAVVERIQSVSKEKLSITTSEGSHYSMVFKSELANKIVATFSQSNLTVQEKKSEKVLN
ncbi:MULTISPECIES: non-ribosomal peptide synthetase [unclassified Colwellia]|uniref:non-ribosomal peptide synthetase n=1 Tax=unclassified Colwellia TaxID=196834 RepID=UPI0015F36331|nr:MULTISPECIES: non-ribosomal peptide synthetase [unclassified Colwellia]MBA6257663.1 amino acid adenylation domain-containing protein [Colwellia sp. MB3u-28]MBA6259420.1 amino acid adenylation domain-containing protein [Colwellia sp. MB3u-41]MBA6304377.1 amino acid adenylation domain-containing protein [Colwellia sp. MB02u-14]